MGPSGNRHAADLSRPDAIAIGVVVALCAGLFLAFPSGANTPAPDCADEVCIEREWNPDGAQFFGTNRSAGPITLRFDFVVLENYEPSKPTPMHVVVPAGERIPLLAIEIDDAPAGAGPSRFQYRWHWRLGTLKAAHDRNTRYALPWSPNARYRTGQSVGGSFTHFGNDRFSYDFLMPVGTAVLAARSGTVGEVVEQHSRGGPLESLKSRANSIAIIHADGTLGRYVHLRHRGAAVTAGQRVAAGDLIGFSGNTGYSTAPHLHFSVVSVNHELEWESIDIRFGDRSAEGFVPQTDQWLAGGRTEQADPSFPAHGPVR